MLCGIFVAPCSCRLNLFSSESAAFSGTPLFHMKAVVSVPPQYNTAKFESGLYIVSGAFERCVDFMLDIASIGDKLGVDVWVESFKPQKITRE